MRIISGLTEEYLQKKQNEREIVRKYSAIQPRYWPREIEYECPHHGRCHSNEVEVVHDFISGALPTCALCGEESILLKVIEKSKEEKEGEE